MDKIDIAKPVISNAEIDFVTETMKSKNIACGKKVKEFEKLFAERMDAEYAVAVTSGTAALCITLKAFGIKSGNVITSPFSFFASTSCIFYNNAIPHFVDIKESDFNIDENKIEKEINSETKAILPVSLFGRYPNVEKINKISKKYKLPVIYDNCQAHAATYGLSRFNGDAVCYSFYPTKNMTCGEGGIILTNDKEIYKKLLMYRNHGMDDKKRYLHLDIGYNYRMTDINACIGLAQLNKLGISNLKRKINAELYNFLLEDTPIICPEIVEGHVFNQYTIRVHNRKEIISKLEENNIGYGIYYPSLISDQPALKHYKLNKVDLSIAKQMTKEVLSLPVHPLVTKDNIKFICNKIKECF